MCDGDKEDDNGGSGAHRAGAAADAGRQFCMLQKTQNCINALTSTQQDNLNVPQLNSLRMYGRICKFLIFLGFLGNQEDLPEVNGIFLFLQETAEVKYIVFLNATALLTSTQVVLLSLSREEG